MQYFDIFRIRCNYEKDLTKLGSEWSLYMKVLNDQNYKLSTLNNPEMKELTALALL